MRTAPKDGEVGYLNVDLDVRGAFDSAPIVAGFGDRVVILYDDIAGGERILSVELAEDADDLGAALDAFVKLVVALPEEAQSAWKSARSRVFDIGFQSGAAPHASKWTLSPVLLLRIAALGAEVAITIYGSEQKDGGALSSAPSR